MRNRYAVWLWLVLFGALCYAAQGGGEKTAPGAQYVGTWNGTWEGGGASGTFEMTLEKDASGAVTGKVSVTEPAYTAAFKALAFDGSKMTAKYDFPPNDQAEVVLAATFDGNKCAGTWSAREKAGDNEVIAGTWTVTKK